MSVKILLDTDIGSDIDDAVCLAYLLAQSQCELLGITTVSGEADKRAMLASALCKIAGQNIPIFPGATDPLLIKQKQPHATQSAALPKWEHQTKFPQGEAVEFLRQTIRANPGEVSLLTIGPLTNIALLFRADPEIPALLKSLVMMCGVFTPQPADKPCCEWNARCDPHAAVIVYETDVAIHRSIGLDVTTQVKMAAQAVKERFSHPLLQPVLDFAEHWFDTQSAITFHDPLAATTIFDPNICKFYPGTVEVDPNDDSQYGFTKWDDQAVPPKHEVALEVDVERFFEHYFGVFR